MLWHGPCVCWDLGNEEQFGPSRVILAKPLLRVFPSQTLIFSLQPLSTSSRGFVCSISSPVPVVLLGVSIMAMVRQGIIRDLISTVKPELFSIFPFHPKSRTGLLCTVTCRCWSQAVGSSHLIENPLSLEQ